MQQTHLDWTLGYTDTLTQRPQKTVPAQIPGEVQLIWGSATGMPDYNFDKNYLQYAFMEDKFWHFESSVFVQNLPQTTPVLFFGGIDYRYTVFIDGAVLADGEGMFTPVEIDLRPYAGQTVKIDAVIHPIPKIPGANGRENAVHSCKPAVGYGWDWHPRLVPSGMFGDVLLQYRSETRITGNDFSYTLSEDLQSLQFLAKPGTNAQTGTVQVQLLQQDGSAAAEKTVPVCDCGEVLLQVEKPVLWWCRGQGKPYFYTYRVRLFDEDGNETDSFSRRVGVRRVKLVLNDNDYYDMGFPKTQPYFPATIELNGRRIFAKGTNFVPIDIFYSKMTAETYRRQLLLAAQCNMNILRLWGGGLVNKEEFFDLCDEMGLMVWQEFPLACNNYTDDPHYLQVLQTQSRSIVLRLKSHPCVVLYCGGNELFNDWSGMTSQSLALRLLDKVCLENDPLTPYNMTSPLYGMGHGCYLNITTSGKEAVTDFDEKFRTAYTEFGSPAPAPLSYIQQYIKPEDLYRIEDGTAWVDHHALYAWNDKNTWFRPKEIEAFYGKADTLEQTIANGLELQGECYKGMFEQARCKWPKTSMAINWCFNEPWPCFANNSLVMYPDVVRPAYQRVKDALRDRTVCVLLHRLRYSVGEQVQCRLAALNDLPQAMPGAAVRVLLCVGGEQTCVFEGEYPQVQGNSVAHFAQFDFTVPAGCPKTFRLLVQAQQLSGEYLLYCVPKPLDLKEELKNHLDGSGRLLRFPVKKKAQILALLYLAQQIEPEKIYTEREINMLLDNQCAFRDSATLRRELYNKRFITRRDDGSAYWKEPQQPTLESFGF